MAQRGKGSNNLKNSTITLFIIGLIIAGGIGWMSVNGITSIQGVYRYFHAWSDEIRECSSTEDGITFRWNCKTLEPSGPSSGGGSGGITDPAPVTPTPDGWYAGVPVFEYDDPAEDYLTALEKLEVGEPEEIEYDRAEWNHWVGDPCDTRRQVLARDGEDVKLVQNGGYCFTEGGTWISPYDDEEHSVSSSLDIDHVVPLYYAAQHGGQEWATDKKQKFANDTNFLLAVTAGENRSKGADGPSEYMPPERDFHCDYAKVWVAGLTFYDLTITEDDKAELKDALQKC